MIRHWQWPTTPEMYLSKMRCSSTTASDLIECSLASGTRHSILPHAVSALSIAGYNSCVSNAGASSQCGKKAYARGGTKAFSPCLLQQCWHGVADMGVIIRHFPSSCCTLFATVCRAPHKPRRLQHISSIACCRSVSQSLGYCLRLLTTLKVSTMTCCMLG